MALCLESTCQLWNPAQRRVRVSCTNNIAIDHSLVTRNNRTSKRNLIPEQRRDLTLMSFLEKMSTSDLMENLREELTCFICLDYFTSPVTTECGHSFCLVCLLRSWEQHNTPFSCPECWRTLEAPHFQPNERLGRLAGIGKQLRSQVLQSEDQQGPCGRMLAATMMYPEDDQGVNAFSSQCHGINRMSLFSEAEEQHKVRLAAQYKFQNGDQVPSLNSHRIVYRRQPSPGTDHKLGPDSALPFLLGSQSSCCYWSSRPLHDLVHCSFVTECLFLLQEKLQEILNLLCKKKKETQVMLTHEKERVILCKVSDCPVCASCIWFREGGISKGTLSEMRGERRRRFPAPIYSMQYPCSGLPTFVCPPGNLKTQLNFPSPGQLPSFLGAPL